MGKNIKVSGTIHTPALKFLFLFFLIAIFCSAKVKKKNASQLVIIVGAEKYTIHEKTEGVTSNSRLRCCHNLNNLHRLE